MITVRNADSAHSVSARTGAGTSLVPGQVVKLAQGAAVGSQPTCVAVTAADMDAVTAGTLMVFIVDYIKPDSQDVDFTFNPATSALTPIAETIPAGAQVNLWYNKPIIGYHDTSLAATLKSGVAREADKVGVLASSGLPAKFNGSATDTGEENFVGQVYAVEGPEVTILFSKI